ncbi:hypothetical protein [Endozoicomonas sp.]|uniref:hypothetical protein n=1 Tax=Endozoicomonas sp. TaxID=1892382 RepID=UPI00288374B3|nr:hypothetical protein [Endozoicomonas sp.]
MASPIPPRSTIPVREERAAFSKPLPPGKTTQPLIKASQDGLSPELTAIRWRDCHKSTKPSIFLNNIGELSNPDIADNDQEIIEATTGMSKPGPNKTATKRKLLTTSPAPDIFAHNPPFWQQSKAPRTTFQTTHISGTIPPSETSSPADAILIKSTTEHPDGSLNPEALKSRLEILEIMNNLKEL